MCSVLVPASDRLAARAGESGEAEFALHFQAFFLEAARAQLTGAVTGHAAERDAGRIEVLAQGRKVVIVNSEVASLLNKVGVHGAVAEALSEDPGSMVIEPADDFFGILPS